MRGILLSLLGWLLIVGANPAPAAPPPLKAYGTLPGFQMAAISPSGNRVALVGVVGDTRQLLIFDSDNKLLRNVNIGTIIVDGILWGGDDRVLVRWSATVGLIDFNVSKTMVSSVLVVPIDKDKTWTIFDGLKTINGGVGKLFAIQQHEGRWYGYFGGITAEYSRFSSSTQFTDGNPELYRVDLVDGDTRRIARRVGGRIWRDWLVDAAGEVAISLDLNIDSGDWKIRNAAGAIVAQGTNRRGGVDLIGLGRKPDSFIFMLEDEASDGHRLDRNADCGRATTGHPRRNRGDGPISGP